jgi:hypothetical protein
MATVVVVPPSISVAIEVAGIHEPDIGCIARKRHPNDFSAIEATEVVMLELHR